MISTIQGPAHEMVPPPGGWSSSYFSQDKPHHKHAHRPCWSNSLTETAQKFYLWQTIKTKQPSSRMKALHRCFTDMRGQGWGSGTLEETSPVTLLSGNTSLLHLFPDLWPSVVKCSQFSVVCSHTWHFLTWWRPLRTCPEKVWKLNFFSQTSFFLFLPLLWFSQSYHIFSVWLKWWNNGF